MARSEFLTVALCLSSLCLGVSGAELQPAAPSVPSQVVAFKTANFGDSLPEVNKKLYQLGLHFTRSEESSFDDLFNACAAAAGVPEAARKNCADKLAALFCCINLKTSAASSEVRLDFIYKKPHGGSLPETALFQVQVNLDLKAPAAAALKKLKADYGEPQIVAGRLEFPVYLKQLEFVPVTLGYTGYKFVVPTMTYVYHKQGVEVRFVKRLPRETFLELSPEQETQAVNAEILKSLPSLDAKRLRAISKLLDEVKLQYYPVCVGMVETLRQGDALSLAQLVVQRDMLDGALLDGNVVTKTDSALFEALRQSVVQSLRDIKADRQEKVKTAKEAAVDI